jgi:D-tyrosyl-tRNA(Tyr) deacylase
MRAVVQRVSRASVRVDGHEAGAIGRGMLVLWGATHGDEAGAAEWLAHKIVGLRVFEDEAGHMNLDLQAVRGGILAVPQFTLYGDVRRGRRPDFVDAARPEHAEPLFESFCAALARAGIAPARGVFRAHMEVELVNDGPVTLMLESPPSAAAGVPG